MPARKVDPRFRIRADRRQLYDMPDAGIFCSANEIALVLDDFRIRRGEQQRMIHVLHRRAEAEPALVVLQREPRFGCSDQLNRSGLFFLYSPTCFLS